MESMGIRPIMEYIRRRQATIAEKVACRPIDELCTDADRRTGTSYTMRLWDQDIVNGAEE